MLETVLSLRIKHGRIMYALCACHMLPRNLSICMESAWNCQFQGSRLMKFLWEVELRNPFTREPFIFGAVTKKKPSAPEKHLNLALHKNSWSLVWSFNVIEMPAVKTSFMFSSFHHNVKCLWWHRRANTAERLGLGKASTSHDGVDAEGSVMHWPWMSRARDSWQCVRLCRTGILTCSSSAFQVMSLQIQA